MMRINIGQRLGLLLASFSLLAALLLGYLTYTAARDMLVERAQRTLLDTTRILSSHLQAGFGQLGRDATMLAMLAGGQHDAFAPAGGLQRRDDRRHLDGLGPGADDDGDMLGVGHASLKPVRLRLGPASHVCRREPRGRQVCR